MSDILSRTKIIAYDLDGTLLTEKKELTPGTRAVLNKLSDAGKELIVCTGRALFGVPEEVKAFSGAHYFITANGAGVYKKLISNEYELIAENLLDNDRARELVKRLRELEVMPDPFIDGKCYMCAEKAYLVDKMNVPDSMKEYIRSSRTIVADMDSFLSKNKIQKITINFASYPDGHRIDIDGVREILKDFPELNAVTGGIRNIEVSDRAATKGDALMAIAKKINVAPSEIIAFGDSENDVTMLSFAGTGVAMENALDVAKAAADFVTASNDDEGVARYLENLFIK